MRYHNNVISLLLCISGDNVIEEKLFDFINPFRKKIYKKCKKSFWVSIWRPSWIWTCFHGQILSIGPEEQLCQFSRLYHNLNDSTHKPPYYQESVTNKEDAEWNFASFYTSLFFYPSRRFQDIERFFADVQQLILQKTLNISKTANRIKKVSRIKKNAEYNFLSRL